jgi:hypothetical protein
MATQQYHEPAAELSSETRTFARMITVLVEEAEAIGWYEQRISLETDNEERAPSWRVPKRRSSSTSEWISNFC